MIEKTLHIWTDGSYDPASHTCGWAFVVKSGSLILAERYGTDVPDGAEAHWNVAGECVAVVNALQYAQSVWGLMSKFASLNFSWTKGHAGDRMNERADELAKLAIRQHLNLKILEPEPAAKSQLSLEGMGR